MTNGDKIRQGTDEQLALLIEMGMSCEDCPLKGMENGCQAECYKGTLMWLKQEVEGDKNEAD